MKIGVAAYEKLIPKAFQYYSTTKHNAGYYDPSQAASPKYTIV